MIEIQNHKEAVWQTTPQFISPVTGMKWWIDNQTTAYATEADAWGTSLPEISCWFVEEPEGARRRVLVRDHRIIDSCERLDGIIDAIDMLKAESREACLR